MCQRADPSPARPARPASLSKIRASSACGRAQLVAICVWLSIFVQSVAPAATLKEMSGGKAGMVRVPGGTFEMGCDDPSFPDAQPVHLVRLRSFWIDRTEVTNKQFARFVEATGYVTVAERTPQAKDFPDAPPENLVPGALVFSPPGADVRLADPHSWWRYVPAASWRHPEGPGSNLDGRWDHPVVQVAWEDAAAYARWAGKRLPTEAEFEYAARGGLVRKRFAWGDELTPGDRWMANTWQGRFPTDNSAGDGFKTTAPVASFAGNGYGLYDLTGNVWEWCSDWYRADYYKTCASGAMLSNPEGPADSYDPLEPGEKKKVQRGGSFLCTDQYCARYLVGARGKGEVKSAYCHVGFRCASD